MRYSQLFAMVLLFITSVSTSTFLFAADTLDGLPKNVQEDIGRICSPVQFREGATAYRNCVRSEVDSRSNQGESPMGELSFDDKYAVQQACAPAGSESNTAFQTCIKNEITGLNREPEPDLSVLRQDEQYAVQQACFGAQSAQGAVAYRRCVNKQLAELNSLPAVNLASMTLLDRNELQLQCSETTSSAGDYRRCLAIATGTALPATATAVASVSRSTTSTPAKPDAQSLTDTSSSQTEPTVSTGTANSNESLNGTNTNTALESNTSTSSMTFPRAIAPPSAETESVAATTQPVEQPSNTATNEATATQTQPSEQSGDSEAAPATSTPASQSASNADTTTQTSTAVNETSNVRVVTADPGPIEPTNGAATSSDTDANSDAEGSNQPTTIVEKAKQLWENSLAWFLALPNTGKALAAALVLVPLALLGLLSGRRRRTDDLYDAAYTQGHAANRYDGPELKSRVRADAHQFDDEFAPSARGNHGPAFSDDDTQGLDALFDKYDDRESTATNSSVQTTADFDNGLGTANQRATAANDEITRMATKEESSTFNTEHRSAGHASFMEWLNTEPVELHRQHCIEFLTYWMAYGDERYAPTLKRRLFTSSDLDAPDTIKRWVLKQDVFAFADVVLWMRQHCDKNERIETIGLLLALLVPENALSPVQNTLLRFLSDAFDIGNTQLNQMFQHAYGHPIPPIPRVDKLAWWDKRTETEIDRWDARKLATLSEPEQFIARLGLPSDFSESDVVQTFRRASRRCHPENFQNLGERERALATRAYEKYEQARDYLLGVEV